jgi:hypothetical protein
MAGIHALEADLLGQGDHGRHFLGIDPRSGERRKAYGVYWRARVPIVRDASRNIENLGLLAGQLAYGSGFGNRVSLRAFVVP